MFLKLLLIFACIFAQIGSNSDREEHLSNIRQLTFGGENAEAYFSEDGTELIFQSTRDGYPCDQIFRMNSDGSDVRKITNGKGRTTCAYFYPDKKRILYSSTHQESPSCPAAPDRSRGYVWGLYPYDIYTADRDGTNVQVLSASPGYDAEATISPDGKQIVFTSDRDGDLELYAMDSNGKNVRRLTHSPGYDGGAFFSADSKKIVWRARHLSDQQEQKDYKDLLQARLVKPSQLEIFVMNADGTGVQQVTRNGAANFCPYFHPDGKRIIFASNVNDPGKRNFDLYLIDIDGKNLKQVTFHPAFDAFPMFTQDGKRLVFASNRDAKKPGETNVFVADWTESVPPIDESKIRKDVEFLASDEMKGRLTGTPEARKSAEYIAAEFQNAELQTPSGIDSFYQQFEFTSGIKLGTTNTLEMKTVKNKKSYVLSSHFLPVGFSDDGELAGAPVIFGGYGIRAPDLKYDDYERIDVKGKIVLCYRFGPEGGDPKSAYSQFYPLRYKAMIARDLGAVALLAVAESEKDDELLKLRRDATFGTSGIPVLSIKRSLFLEWIEAAGVKVPEKTDPHSLTSFDLPGVQISLTTTLLREKSKSDNVLGWLPAKTPTKETLIIGAHYDHLGTGTEGSLSPKWDVVHNGADDNASGVAGLLELARFFGKRKEQLQRNMLFIAFGGEELGVLGSSYFTKNPVIPIQDVIAMLNMDMIGRLRDEKLVVGGTGTSPVWKEMLQASNQERLKITFNEDGYGPSDHSVFYARNIPVLFFFTGAHAQYHKPEDDAALIEYKGMVAVLNYVSRIAEKIVAMPSKPEFVKVKSREQAVGTGGFRVYLGTIPDYSEDVKGVKLTGVRDGSPAEKAGILGGDIIVEFGGKKIENVYDYTYALQQQKPGDIVTVVVLRNDQKKSLRVTLQ
ncbi:M28 family peptidase, partial [bacterium]|nr:M28 family peptidase [bacterium]